MSGEVVRTRVLHFLYVTTNPDGRRVTQAARNFSDLDDAGQRFRFLVRDRDAKFTAALDAVLGAVDIEAIKTLTPGERVRGAVRGIG